MKSMTRWIAAVGCVLGVMTLAHAQESEASAEVKSEEAPRDSKYFFEAALWGAQPLGLQYEPASIADFDTGELTTLSMRFGTEARGRYRVGYNFGHNVGEIVGTYWSQQNRDTLFRSDPSNFVFGESKVATFGAGVFDDGFADGFEAFARTKTRDFRLDYYRDAFELPRAKGRWFVGLRRFDHQRLLRVSYFALAANLPIVVNPDNGQARLDLNPNPDVAGVSSSYSGRGVEAGLEVMLPIVGRKFWVDGGFSVAALRGRTVAHHSSLTNVYTLTDIVTNTTVILEPPFDDIFNDPDNAKDLGQLAVVGATNENGSITSGLVVETFLEFRCNPWNRLEVFAGFRGARYDGVGKDLGLTLTSTAVDRSVGYEGYYAGASYRY